jgi:protein Mpv17
MIDRPLLRLCNWVLILSLSGSTTAAQPFIPISLLLHPSQTIRRNRPRPSQALAVARGGQRDLLPKVQMSLLPIMSALTAYGKIYAKSLETSPILTKSLTASCVFTLSDYVAQRLEARGNKKTLLSGTRLVAGALIGLLYFGPASHYWYETIFRLLPGTSFVSTLQKAALGQLLFGPAFTCIFFASGLIQSRRFTMATWVAKIRSDLPRAWLAGAGYWPLVDLVSYSLVPQQWIPLFINACSLVWTIYLSLLSNNASSATTTTRTA